MDPTMSVRISAVICTHNRARLLRSALRSLTAQTLDTSCYEILVVDNGSGDETRTVVDDERSSEVTIRYVYEGTVGVSHARNAGWRNARATLVAYLDDDAIAEPPWLETMFHFLERTKPQPGAVGGKIEPIWPRPRPTWLSEEMARSLTIVNWSDQVSVLKPEEWIAASNIGFPRQVLEDIGGFRPDLGRQGPRLLSNEEILARIQIEAMGYRCYFHPGLVVRHHIHASRLTRSWFKKRLYWQGVSDAWMRRYLSPRSSPRWFVRGAGSLVRQILTPREIRSLARSPEDPSDFDETCLAWYRIGYNLGRMGLVGRTRGVSARR
jgi:glucosyl-dolichyl phosphate glucuronosyltransferase